jgi:lipopolysaccharide/colanic/teichoic acid biosynthesis glycosyltransferase
VIDVALTWPLFLLYDAAIKLDSLGPVLFSQERLGLHGKHFTIFKFRTMVQDADKNISRWSALRDPRGTRAGRWLRLIRLDELT